MVYELGMYAMNIKELTMFILGIVAWEVCENGCAYRFMVDQSQFHSTTNQWNPHRFVVSNSWEWLPRLSGMIFEWCMVRCGSHHKHQKVTCRKRMDHIVSSLFNVYMDDYRIIIYFWTCMISCHSLIHSSRLLLLFPMTLCKTKWNRHSFLNKWEKLKSLGNGRWSPMYMP